MTIAAAAIAIVASCVFWATTFVPVKAYKAGDGMFYQLTMALGIFLVGLFVHLLYDSPRFDPIAMIGGIMWATGNVCCVTIVETVGLGMGMLLWGLVNTFTGWACGFFGILGVATQSVPVPALNVAGVIVVALGAAIMALLNPTANVADDDDDVDVELGKVGVAAVENRAKVASDAPDGSANDAAVSSASQATSPTTATLPEQACVCACSCGSAAITPAPASSSSSSSTTSQSARATPSSGTVVLPSPSSSKRQRDNSNVAQQQQQLIATSSAPPLTPRSPMNVPLAHHLMFVPVQPAPLPSASPAQSPSPPSHASSPDENVPEWIHRLTPLQRKLVGFALAIFAGLLFGTNFNPVQHQIDQGTSSPDSSHSTHALDYLFSHFIGILLAALVYFGVYCAWQRNRPEMNPQLALPGIVSGVMWGVAETCLFIANGELQQVIVTPICCIMPGVLASVIGVVFYKEMPGRRNLLVLIASITVSSVGVIMIALSKAL